MPDATDGLRRDLLDAIAADAAATRTGDPDAVRARGRRRRQARGLLVAMTVLAAAGATAATLGLPVRDDVVVDRPADSGATAPFTLDQGRDSSGPWTLVVTEQHCLEHTSRYGAGGGVRPRRGRSAGRVVVLPHRGRGRARRRRERPCPGRDVGGADRAGGPSVAGRQPRARRRQPVLLRQNARGRPDHRRRRTGRPGQGARAARWTSVATLLRALRVRQGGPGRRHVDFDHLDLDEQRRIDQSAELERGGGWSEDLRMGEPSR